MSTGPCPSPCPKLCKDLPHHQQTAPSDLQYPSPSALWPSANRLTLHYVHSHAAKSLHQLFFNQTAPFSVLMHLFSKKEFSRWWDGSVCWKASVCCKQCLRWRPVRHLHLGLLCPEVEMGCGPSQENSILPVTGISRLPLPLHRQPFDLGTARRLVHDSKSHRVSAMRLVTNYVFKWFLDVSHRSNSTSI